MNAAANTESKIHDWLERRRPEMLTLLRDIVNTDSGSSDKIGVDAAGAVLVQFFERAGIPVSFMRDRERGDAIIAKVARRDSNDASPILLMGHRDTVFAKGEAAKRPFRIEGNLAFGPGVNDMKAGLVINAFVLAAFNEIGGHPASIQGLFTGDEEIASPFSRLLIEEEARKARAVFNAEPARPTGNVVKGRKGAIFMLLEVFGRAAHSGVNFFEGSSAIDELADKIVRLRSITDGKKGITANIGLIRGGQTVNTVAPYAAAEIDIRFVTKSDREAVLDSVQAIADSCVVPGTHASLSIVGEFLPLEPTENSDLLFDLYRSVAAELGVKVDGEFTGGCADSGFASAQGTPTLCGVGAVGGKSHTPEEYIEVNSLVERAKILAISIHRLGPLHQQN
jgi:glutamate carboxypeptidase